MSSKKRRLKAIKRRQWVWELRRKWEKKNQENEAS